MIRRIALSAVAGLVAALTLTGCGGSAASSPSDDVDGTWGDTSANFLTLTDGKLTGHDGCNKMNGSYTVDGSEISVTLGAAIARGCTNVDTWLRDIATASVSGDTLTVFDRTGAEIGTLPRTA